MSDLKWRWLSLLCRVVGHKWFWAGTTEDGVRVYWCRRCYDEHNGDLF